MHQTKELRQMWKVQYTHAQGHRVYHGEDFHTRKAARLWCKRTGKTDMVLHGPNGEVESFCAGAVQCES